jgi:hypothetical protein
VLIPNMVTPEISDHDVIRMKYTVVKWLSKISNMEPTVYELYDELLENESMTLSRDEHSVYYMHLSLDYRFKVTDEEIKQLFPQEETDVDADKLPFTITNAEENERGTFTVKLNLNRMHRPKTVVLRLLKPIANSPTLEILSNPRKRLMSDCD